MTDDAWRAKWGNLTREQAEHVVESARASRAAQQACEHCWHSSGVVTRQAILGGATSEQVYCCHCYAMATMRQRFERYTPDGHGKWLEAWRPLPETYEIEYTTVPTLDP